MRDYYLQGKHLGEDTHFGRLLSELNFMRSSMDSCKENKQANKRKQRQMRYAFKYFIVIIYILYIIWIHLMKKSIISSLQISFET